MGETPFAPSGRKVLEVAVWHAQRRQRSVAPLDLAGSEYLGHRDPGFTLVTYAHLMPESEDRARAAIDAALGAPAESTRSANRL